MLLREDSLALRGGQGPARSRLGTALLGGPAPWRRLQRLAGVAGAQAGVQVIGFVSAMVLVRHMPQADYGYFTLALSLLGTATVLTDLGLASAVNAGGGRLLGRQQPLSALAPLAAEAAAMHRVLAGAVLALLLPLFAWMLVQRLQAPPWQVALLVLLVGATAWMSVRGSIALAVLRLAGDVAFQQKLDLGLNLAKLALFGLAAWWTFDAAMACLVMLGVAAWQCRRLEQRMRLRLGSVTSGAATAAATHRGELIDFLRRQAPNALYFVFSSQIALWLLGVLGDAQTVAEAGALGRLAAVFNLVGIVSATLLLPWIARRPRRADFITALAWINAFYAVLLGALVALALAAPDLLLWVLGPRYATLQAELVWMVTASTFAAWAGTLFSAGVARGWVQPVALGAGIGLLTTAAAALSVDASTVRGAFVINTAVAVAGTLVTLAYLLVQIRRCEDAPQP